MLWISWSFRQGAKNYVGIKDDNPANGLDQAVKFV
jgi:hypothetical protein